MLRRRGRWPGSASEGSDHDVLVRPRHELVGYAGMGIGMVLFWALIVAGLVALVLYVAGDRRTQRPPQTANEILAARFVRGEISETEYRDRLATLRDPARH